MEKLAVEGAVSGAASGSKNPDGKADHWPAGVVSTKEEGEKVIRITESQPLEHRCGRRFRYF